MAEGEIRERDGVEVEADKELAVPASALLDQQTGKFRVLSRKCDTCIFRSGNRMHLAEGRLQQLVDEAADSFIVCHETLPETGQPIQQAVCRGFCDGFGHNSGTLRVLLRLFGIELVEPPE